MREKTHFATLEECEGESARLYDKHKSCAGHTRERRRKKWRQASIHLERKANRKQCAVFSEGGAWRLPLSCSCFKNSKFQVGGMKEQGGRRIQIKRKDNGSVRNRTVASDGRE